MGTVKVKVVNNSDFDLPKYATKGSAGLDLCATIENDDKCIKLNPGAIVLIPTGLYVEIPAGYEIQVRSRSGMAFKHGVVVLNAPGTIDSDYRGEIMVILINLGKNEYIINSGDRIAQGVLAKVEQIEWQEDSLDESERGEGGFGHTGKN